MPLNKECYLLARRPGCAGDRDYRFNKPLHPAETDLLERHLRSREALVEAGLPDAQDIGDILRRCTMKTTIGEDLCGGIQDDGAAMPWVVGAAHAAPGRFCFRAVAFLCGANIGLSIIL